MSHVGVAYERNLTLVVNIQDSHTRKGCLSSTITTSFGSHSIASYQGTNSIEISILLTANIIAPESIEDLKRISRKTTSRCIKKYLLISALQLNSECLA